MWVFDPLNPESYQPGLGHAFPATARSGVMDRAQFIAAESHGIPLGKAVEVRNKFGGDSRWKPRRSHTACSISALGESMSNLANVVQQLKKERDQAQRRVEQVEQALKALSGFGGSGGSVRTVGRPLRSGAKRRTMSAAARKRIATAQRARWAK
jgi:hypothetical protein